MKILIVDDVATIRGVLRLTLETKGHQIKEASDGSEALSILAAEPVDAVISDILMPNMDGFTLCHEIRKNEKLRHLPFLLFTQTYTTEHDRKLGLMVGADDYLFKPASPHMIVATLQRVTEERRTGSIPIQFQAGEAEVLKNYSQSLVHKLEQRNIELQDALDQIKAFNATLEQKVADRTAELTRALAEVKELTGLLPICSYCKRIRDDKNYWVAVEKYIAAHSKAQFSHGFCPDCLQKHVLPMLNAFDVAGPIMHESDQPRSTQD